MKASKKAKNLLPPMPTARLDGFAAENDFCTKHVTIQIRIRLLSHVFREASTCSRNTTRLLRTQTVRLCCLIAVNDFRIFGQMLIGETCEI